MNEPGFLFFWNRLIFRRMGTECCPILEKRMKQIKEIRESKGMSQWKLAKEAGVNQSRISLIENDLVLPNTKEINRISAALNAQPEELFGLDAVMKRLVASRKRG